MSRQIALKSLMPPPVKRLRLSEKYSCVSEVMLFGALTGRVQGVPRTLRTHERFKWLDSHIECFTHFGDKNFFSSQTTLTDILNHLALAFEQFPWNYKPSSSTLAILPRHWLSTLPDCLHLMHKHIMFPRTAVFKISTVIPIITTHGALSQPFRTVVF